MTDTCCFMFNLRRDCAQLFIRPGAERAWIIAITLVAIAVCAVSECRAYSFTHFGGRRGRAGVTDSLYMWNIGTSGGDISWYLNRDQLSLADANDAQFTTLESLIQPQLDKWAVWLNGVTFSHATSAATAKVVIEFETTFDGTGQDVPSQNGAGAATQYNSRTGTILNTAEIGFWPSNRWANNNTDFGYVVLHEWGHILGVGDEYLTGTLAGEDFIDHGFPSGPTPKSSGKADNVMNTRGVLTLDNDDIAAAQWAIGAASTDALVTGKLLPRAAGDNTTGVAAHHGPGTWTYRGTSSDAAPGGGTVVTLNAIGATAARSVGPGTWTTQILANQVVFTSAAGYAGNFIFEIDSTNPEGYITAQIVDNTPTSFTAIPLANGRQISPNPMVFGPVPEPAALWLLLSGGAIGFAMRRRYSPA